MRLIVAVDKTWGIGKNNDLLISIPEDMKYFRSMTSNGTVIMGRRTLESFPNGKPLKNRVNIVLSSSTIDDVLCFSNIPDLLDYIKANSLDDAFVIGGGSVYRQLLQYCDTAYITKIDFDFGADTFFPNLDDMSDWKCISETEEKIWNDIPYKFTVYKKE